MKKTSQEDSKFLKAINKLLRVASTRTAKLTVYTSSLLAIATLAPGMQLPPELAAVAGSVGVNALSSMLERVANGENISDNQLAEKVESAIEESGIKEVLTRDNLQAATAQLINKQGQILSLIKENENHVIEQFTEEISDLKTLITDLKKQIGEVRAQEQNKEVDRAELLAKPKRDLTIKVFVAYTSEVENEVRHIKSVIDEINLPFSFADTMGCRFQLVTWQDVPPGAGNPQERILNWIRIGEIQLLVGVLWTRYGSPTGLKDPLTDSEYMSGIEAELKTAYRQWLITGNPRILMYRSDAPLNPSLIDAEQLSKVNTFMSSFHAHGDMPALYHQYTSLDDFQSRFRMDINRLLPRLVKDLA